MPEAGQIPDLQAVELCDADSRLSAFDYLIVAKSVGCWILCQEYQGSKIVDHDISNSTRGMRGLSINFQILRPDFDL